MKNPGQFLLALVLVPLLVFAVGQLSQHNYAVCYVPTNGVIAKSVCDLPK